MSTLLKKFNPSHLFEISPTVEFHYYWVLLILFIAVFIAALIVSRTIKKDKILKSLLKKPTRNLKILNIIGLILLFSRYEKIPYLAMRIWWMITILLIIYICGKIIYVYKTHYPKKIDELNKTNEKNKYLPEFKNKKRR